MRREIVIPLLALLVVVGALWFIEWRGDQEVKDFAISNCNRSNLERAYELANRSDGAARLRLARDTQPIVNCEASVEENHGILVSGRVERKYVRLVVKQRLWPTIGLDGKIANTQALPSRTQRP